MPQKGKLNLQGWMLIIVAALGYFVDIYDLILFNVIKHDSLISLGITDPEGLKNNGIQLFNWQMGGMLFGGILWGILGDKKGRIKVLFGSILMYSLANIANAFVTDIPSYAFVRFIAGVGLAGELGAGITLVAEVMSKETRGYGTMIIVTFGVLGAVLAAFVGGEEYVAELTGNPKGLSGLIHAITGTSLENWQIAYIIGGVLGLMLLLLRVGTLESAMFSKMHHGGAKKGDFFALFAQRERFLRYLRAIMIGLPVWYAIGILIALSQDFATAGIIKVNGEVVNGHAVMYAYLGLSAGDLLSGLLSQIWKSRKKVVVTYLIFCVIMIFMYFFTTAGKSVAYFYWICFLIGVSTGFWALFVTMAAEQFGTNIRSTVTTTVPNFVRGALIPITWAFKLLEQPLGTTGSAITVGLACILLALLSVLYSHETFAKDLDYVETM
ncbi:MAG: MFS transporter [Bacteroidia bacterium]|nr:MFS transporter [Bacteroidia bacterium]